uniref:Zinc finger B-box domain-containing protein 1 isoform X4 n=1 Tax=Geotrypetes seraphini TaxID=260995 RepID=A0A6P8SCL3_GEOSA|nr:zinc finger B-box domain-containing protein 1 isoform X4 [Geotrypetes seraphini]
MNTSDFITCPGSKSGYAAKLKAKQLRELRLETVQLELENQEMEEKLLQLRRSMSREKEERERSNVYHWKSGSAASVSNQNQARIQNKENAGKTSSGKIRLKIFKDQMQESIKQSVKASKTAGGDRPKVKGKACGQCETKSALLVCLECGEDYCTYCYARFHQKGALKFHRTVPVQTVSSVSTRTESRNESGGVLLNGVFETESTGSLKEILMEWRKENEEHKEREISQESEQERMGNSEVQTVLTVANKTVDIEFKENGLTYLEKLLLKKHRRISVGLMPTMHHQVEFKCSHPPVDESQYGMNEEDDGLTAEELEAHEQYAALFRTEKSEKDPERPQPSLKIVELDDVCEQGLEESRIFMVDEADCSDSDINERNEPLIENQTLWLGEKSKSALVQLNESVCPFLPRSTPSFEFEDLSPGSYTTTACKINTNDANHSSEDIGHSLEERCSHDMLHLEKTASADSLTGLQRIALREKKRATSKYHGLEEFFIIGLDPGNARSRSLHSQNASLSLKKNEISFAADGAWRPNSSLSENADDLIVQHILSDEIKKSSESLNKRIAGMSLVHKTSAGYNYPRCLSANPGKHSSISFLSPRPKTALPRPLSRAASEMSEIEYIDVIEQDNSLFGEAADQQTLTGLEKELYILDLHADSQKNLYSLTAGDLLDQNSCLKNNSETTGISESPGFEDHISAIAARSSDEECEREKYEALWDKETVKSLQ